ncbi:histone-lysine N-methyltransferase ASHR2 [Punica granatum]|uniref:Histone-lysine N-methyltransferase ASHR2 n=1 Tax=Punica granatum TaxID=22663 RepID=A0A218WVC9_PUNGR|nr:histone-lysine N-methyltransferase ASHR2 [Punica granatum]OWM76310.1 hypothetical protein CDL15_Pgr009956 [Punica granatum]
MPTAENAAAPLLNVAEMQGRGRALVAAQPLRGGQVVLRDSPILLYSALPFTGGPSSSSSTTIHRYCDHCFRALQSAPVLCPSCRHHAFCSPACLGVASVSSHSPWACQTLARLIDCSSFLGQPPELQVQARFLVASYNLSITSPEDFQVLQSLQGRDICSDDTASSVQLLHPLIASVCPPPPTPFPHGFSPELSANLLSKDKLNAFGLMEPFGAGGERSVRAYGIYPRASFFNHDCLPNACRFDYVDTVPDHNTDIVVRMIHDVPQGREICVSYFPVNLNYPSRQKRLAEDYGFRCECDRCNVEANWSDHEEDVDDGVEEMEDEGGDEMEGSSDADIEAEKENDFPHEYFFVRYVCNRENCFGTLAPLPPSADGAASEIMECNVCGQLKRANDGEEEEMGE